MTDLRVCDYDVCDRSFMIEGRIASRGWLTVETAHQSVEFGDWWAIPRHFCCRDHLLLTLQGRQ